MAENKPSAEPPPPDKAMVDLILKVIRDSVDYKAQRPGLTAAKLTAEWAAADARKRADAEAAAKAKE